MVGLERLTIFHPAVRLTLFRTSQFPPHSSRVPQWQRRAIFCNRPRMVRILDMAMSSSASLRRESASQRFDAGGWTESEKQSADYERIGILVPAERVSGQRRYDATVLQRLAVSSVHGKPDSRGR